MLTELLTPHPWEPAWKEWEEDVEPVLKEHGQKLGEKAREGDENAKNVINLYHQLYRSFDPVTLTFLREALTACGLEVGGKS